MMNNNAIITNAARFLGLLLLQGLVLKRISLGWDGVLYLNVLLYPLFIILIPFRTPRTAQLLLAFALGMLLDFFYDSPGVHASAGVFTAFIRPFILRRMAPRDGYNINHSPTLRRMGLTWFLTYASIMLAFHLFFYFSVEAFTFVFLGEIILKTIFSYVLSMIFILIVMGVFNPMD